ncbi:MAG TPA: bifunctional helix-turn-helix transcriptional regulator/GNAT family N-acetyltransferase [Chthoniobacter sp.]|nr:bifunctional helix-turn-helix transcriptional regulator/GNAT family N-acetyltransferase [Chthoniobacter sp.]
MRPIEQRADSVREFNRFYMSRIGMLGDVFLESDFSVSEVRLLYEVAHRDRPTASKIGAALGLDPAYLSRTLRKFEKRGLITTVPGADRRCRLLELTPAGRKAFAPLERKARSAIVELLQPLATNEQQQMIESMQAIRVLLGDPDVASKDKGLYLIRSPAPGDLGWIVHRHGVLYAQEYGYDQRFEGEVAEVVATFARHQKPGRDQCWVAERDGEIVGSVLLVAQNTTTAQLHLLLVEPKARGSGLGRRLVGEAIRFARTAGYQRIRLWTQAELKPARKLYQSVGFKIVAEETRDSFGKKLKVEMWELKL